MLKRFLTGVALVAALVSGVWDKSAAQATQMTSLITLQNAVTATGNGTVLDVSPFTSVALQVTISNTATVTFEATADGSTWSSIVCINTNSTSATMVTTASATGTFQCNVAGLSQFRARVSAYTSGTVTVKGRSTTAIFAKKGGGGGGSAATSFDQLTGGTNAGNDLVVGNGTTLHATGTGAIQATTADTATTATTASALAANGANCSAGQAAAGVTAAGAAEGCTDYQEEPASTGLVAKTAANTSAARAIVGTANQVSISNGNGVSGDPTIALSSTLVIPGAQIDFTEAAGDGTCNAADFWVRANSTTNKFRKCENGSITDLDTGGAGSIGGSTGATDNAVLRADGVGGGTVQNSSCTISDAGLMTCPGGFAGSGAGTGGLILLEGTAPGDGSLLTGETIIYFDVSDHKFKTQLKGGSVVTYARTIDDLSIFAATTSAQFAGVLSDEIGTSGGFVRGTGATLTNLTVAGSAISFPAGVTQTFAPNGTNAGFNWGSVAGDPSGANNADCWYNTSTSKLRCRQGGANVDVISTGAGTGDVTDVNAGAGISVTNSGGPAPTVTLDPSTFVNNFTFWDGANANRTITYNVTGTDPVITFSSSSVDVTTGTLKEGGVSVSLPARSETLTNKSVDAEGTGNTITIPRRIWLPAAGVNAGTAGSIWDLPSSNGAVAAAVAGTNTIKGVLDFADGSNLSAQTSYLLPSTWTGAIDAKVKWFSSTTSGDVVWQIGLVCVADGETDDPAFNGPDAFTADTTKGTTNQTNDASKTGLTTTGCAAGELMHIKILRDSGHASDTMAGTARLIGVELTIREAL